MLILHNSIAQCKCVQPKFNLSYLKCELHPLIHTHGPFAFSQDVVFCPSESKMWIKGCNRQFRTDRDTAIFLITIYAWLLDIEIPN